MASNFIHLHVHSDYSLKDAAVSVMSLADKAEELGMSHLALTDHGNMFGVMEFLAACKETVVIKDGEEQHEKRKNPVKPIIGCEVYVAPGSRLEKKGSEYDSKYYHLVLLAYNREGYFNLVKLCSYAYIDGFYHRPRIDDELLAKYHGGLIALSACASGEIPRLIQTGNVSEAKKKAVFYKELFGVDEDGNPNFYLEIQDHGIPSNYFKESELSQKEINDNIVLISGETGIPLVATNDVHYLERDDFIAHDILLCVGSKNVRTDDKRKKYYKDQFYFKSGDEMSVLFEKYPEAIENTMRIANRCKTDIPNIDTKEMPNYLPDFKIPEGFNNADAYLRHLSMEGLKMRYAKEMTANGDKWKEIIKRAEYELETIISMGFTGYFLIVQDFIIYAKERDIPVGPGRGSGAGSIIAYALRITDIEPLKYNLLFERFLNPERVSMPDFDIDFAKEGREDVINYISKTYGEDRVGQIITFGTFGAKQAIKDVARVLGIPLAESEMIAKLVPAAAKMTLEKALKGEIRLRELEQDPRYVELFSLARKLEGLVRHLSIHPAGVVIGKYPLTDLVPLYKEPNDSKHGKTGGIATQFEFDYLEKCGLVKMDCLGIKTLDVIKNTTRLIRERGGKYASFDVEKVPEDDRKTFKMLGEGNSYEIFQFESAGMQDNLKLTKPNSIEDLIALNAMYRPGPMENIPRFIECKNGRQEITYPHPSLEGVLKETYGVIVYQEQVMQVAQEIAGYSMGQADILRRAMGKKKKEVIEKERIPFIEGAVKRGFSMEKAKEIYDELVPFAEYGFNKSHSAAYAIIAYRTAYLKANFPAEFMAATLTNEINSPETDKLSLCIDEAGKLGIKVDPPDINKSNVHFAVVSGRIIFGFLGIKGVGVSSAQEIVKTRQNGLYKSFIDFLDRVDIKSVGKKTIELLIQTGAFDNFGITRETLIGNLDNVFDYILRKKEDEMFGQSNLFGDAGESGMPEYRFTDYPSLERTERLNLEKKLIGFYFSGHPMDDYKDIWKKAVTADLSDIENLKIGNCILVGIINVKREINTAKGKMAFASLADYNGEIEVTFFTGPWERCRNNIKDDTVIILKGRIDYQKDKDKYSFIADSVLSKYEIDDILKEQKDKEEKEKIHRNTWVYMADLKSSFVSDAKKGSYTAIGYLRSINERKDRNGDDYAFGTLQDFEGEIKLVFFAKVYAECRHLLKIDEMIALRGSIDPDNEMNQGNIRLKVTSIADYPQLNRIAARKEASGEAAPSEGLKTKAEEPPEEIHINLIDGGIDNDDYTDKLRDFLAENSGPCLTYIHFLFQNNMQTIRANYGLDTSNSSLIEGLKKLECVADVWRK